MILGWNLNRMASSLILTNIVPCLLVYFYWLVKYSPFIGPTTSFPQQRVKSQHTTLEEYQKQSPIVNRLTTISCMSWWYSGCAGPNVASNKRKNELQKYRGITRHVFGPTNQEIIVYYFQSTLWKDSSDSFKPDGCKTKMLVSITIYLI